MLTTPNSRLELFQDRVAHHVLYKRLAKKLSEAEFDEVVTFIEDHDHLGHLEFEYAVLRMHLDRAKSKNWTIVQELALVANCFMLKSRFQEQRK